MGTLPISAEIIDLAEVVSGPITGCTLVSVVMHGGGVRLAAPHGACVRFFFADGQERSATVDRDGVASIADNPHVVRHWIQVRPVEACDKAVLAALVPDDEHGLHARMQYEAYFHGLQVDTCALERKMERVMDAVGRLRLCLQVLRSERDAKEACLRRMHHAEHGWFADRVIDEGFPGGASEWSAEPALLVGDPRGRAAV